MISKRVEGTIEGWLSKREDLFEEERQAFIEYVRGMSNVEALATGRWFSNGVVRVPEDQPKVSQAIKVAKCAKVDPLRYGSPMEVLDTFKGYKIKGEAIDPKSVPQLSGGRNVGDVSYGIRVYDVEDNNTGQQAMREIINTHFGVDSNPWCLLQGDGKGNLSSGAWKYWNHYNGVSKRVAFKDGKLLAFCANNYNSDCWWDRKDEPHNGISFDMKMPNDELGREATYEINEDGTLNNPTNIHKGNKQNGVYEEWYDNGLLRLRETYKNGKLDGLWEAWYANEQLWQRINYKNGKSEGLSEEWYENGQLKERLRYKDGRPDGLWEEWYANGQLWLRGNYNNGRFDGLYEEWYDNGLLRLRETYKNGKREGLYEIWDMEGNLIRVHFYQSDELIATGDKALAMVQKEKESVKQLSQKSQSTKVIKRIK